MAEIKMKLINKDWIGQRDKENRMPFHNRKFLSLKIMVSAENSKGERDIENSGKVNNQLGAACL